MNVTTEPDETETVQPSAFEEEPVKQRRLSCSRARA